MPVILRRRSFVAKALLGALVGTGGIIDMAEAEDEWPTQPLEKLPEQSFRDGFLPPFSKRSILKQGGFFFRTPEALRLFKSGYSREKLLDTGRLIVIKPGVDVTALEGFVAYSGRAHAEALGDGYVILNGEF